jgi:Cu(I)/Ag(I) efflux system membrane fusion protein
MTEIAFRKTAGGFMAHKIITGIRSGKDIQVLSGLSAADTIAINGQYFIDSESFIKPSSK